jgi:hypothetical protein
MVSGSRVNRTPHGLATRARSLSDGRSVAGDLAAADVLAILITEINPHNDPDGVHVRRLSGGFADALRRAMGR